MGDFGYTLRYFAGDLVPMITKFNLLFPPISMVGLFVVQNVYMRAHIAAAGYRVSEVSSRSG